MSQPITKKQFFSGHILLMSEFLEQLAFIAAVGPDARLVIEQLKGQRLIMDELISCGYDIDPARIKQILMEYQKKMAVARQWNPPKK